MGDEVKEIIYTATNLIFIAAVLFVALMFFGLRSNYANTLAERQVSEQRIEQQNQFNGYGSKQVTGYDVMSAITTYSSDVPMYVTGAYNYVDGTTIQDRIYSSTTRIAYPNWFKMSLLVDPVQDPMGMQSTYHKESIYYSIVTYDGDSPQQLAKDMGLDTMAGRSAGSFNASVANKIIWLNTKFMAARPKGEDGYTVSGILFVCIDAQGAPMTEYQLVSIY